MGDSAGGNLVVQCCTQLRDHGASEGLSQPAGNVQISPWVNIDSIPSIRHDVVYQDCLNKRTFSQFDHGEYYPSVRACTNEAEKRKALTDPSISPMYGNFVGLCPTLVTYGGTEVFQHDIQKAITAYQRDGVDLEIVTSEKSPHVWIICSVLSPNHKLWKKGCATLAHWSARVIEDHSYTE